MMIQRYSTQVIFIVGLLLSHSVVLKADLRHATVHNGTMLVRPPNCSSAITQIFANVGTFREIEGSEGFKGLPSGVNKFGGPDWTTDQGWALKNGARYFSLGYWEWGLLYDKPASELVYEDRKAAFNEIKERGVTAQN